MSSQKTILAIETSCDETGIAILRQKDQPIEVLAEKISSQIDIHKETGGVVPEIAAREHVTVIQPMIKQVFKDAKVEPSNLNAIAVTIGPGLMPALSIGVTTAQTLSYALNKPIIPVHHLEGHIYSALLRQAEKTQKLKTQLSQNKPPRTTNIPNTKYQIPDTKTFPTLALIVSGGHTMLVKIEKHLHYQVLGSTRDDAAGEAFDKIARLLGFSYPGGPAISQASKQGDPDSFKFTPPMIKSGNLDFSFSGLKTEVLYTVRDLDEKPLTPKTVNNLAASFQKTVVDTLVTKTNQAIKQVNPQTLLLTGGVAANKLLRDDFQTLADENKLPLKTSPQKLCGDNATMIGLAGLFAYQSGRTKKWSNINAKARINLEEYSVSEPAP
jgi:N6-L-threonylcarbamoyladenine synthase